MSETYRVLHIEPFGLMGVCSKCGAVVADPAQHDAFHLALEHTAFAQKEQQ